MRLALASSSLSANFHSRSLRFLLALAYQKLKIAWIKIANQFVKREAIYGICIEKMIYGNRFYLLKVFHLWEYFPNFVSVCVNITYVIVCLRALGFRIDRFPVLFISLWLEVHANEDERREEKEWYKIIAVGFLLTILFFTAWLWHWCVFAKEI